MGRYRSTFRPYKERHEPTASLTWDNLVGAYKLTFDYEKWLVEFITTHVPSHERSWNPREKYWLLDERNFDIFDTLLRLKFKKVTIIKKEEVEKKFNQGGFQPTPIDRGKELTTFGALIREANLSFDEVKDFNLDSIKKLHRRAALYFHPDRNPQHADKMSSLNASFQNLKETLERETANVS